ncbi:MAG: hypothetical protein LBD55_04240 [Treponema sp.]|jgi:hypothetical protein|nr:hypothetical protein [Treponema sp.]
MPLTPKPNSRITDAPDTAAKNDARSLYEHEIRAFIKRYLYNPAVTGARAKQSLTGSTARNSDG